LVYVAVSVGWCVWAWSKGSSMETMGNLRQRAEWLWIVGSRDPFNRSAFLKWNTACSVPRANWQGQRSLQSAKLTEAEMYGNYMLENTQHRWDSNSDRLYLAFTCIGIRKSILSTAYKKDDIWSRSIFDSVVCPSAAAPWGHILVPVHQLFFCLDQGWVGVFRLSRPQRPELTSEKHVAKEPIWSFKRSAFPMDTVAPEERLLLSQYQLAPRLVSWYTGYISAAQLPWIPSCRSCPVWQVLYST
jgi:hypothetical protein